MKIKVCGLRESNNIANVAGLSPDYMGFICYDQSPRFIGKLDSDLLDDITTDIIKTGVFVDEDADTISKLIYKYKFDAIQLHGSESPDFCDMFKHEVQVIKAFGIDKNFDFDKLNAYRKKVDHFLFDTKTAAYGGSGRVFDWKILNNYNGEVPFFISGGIGGENIAAVKNIRHPMLYGVDLNSKFETSPGIKDIAKLTAAFEIINSNRNEVRS